MPIISSSGAYRYGVCRRFLERKVEGPSAIRLWPGLYFDSDTKSTKGSGAGGKKFLKGEGLAAKYQVSYDHCHDSEDHCTN